MGSGNGVAIGVPPPPAGSYDAKTGGPMSAGDNFIYSLMTMAMRNDPNGAAARALTPGGSWDQIVHGNGQYPMPPTQPPQQTDGGTSAPTPGANTEQASPPGADPSQFPWHHMMHNYHRFMHPRDYRMDPAAYWWGGMNNMPGNYGSQPPPSWPGAPSQQYPSGAPSQQYPGAQPQTPWPWPWAQSQQAPGTQSPVPMPPTQPTATPNPASNMYGGKGPGRPIGTGM